MPKYFTLAEMLRSDTAAKKGIDNTPTWDDVAHLLDLTETILDPLRAAWGKAVRVSSGFRCSRLNTAVGGARKSVHMIGYAADLQTSGSFDKFWNFVLDWLSKSGTKFDQVIVEKDTRTGARWVHIGLYNNSGQQRGIVQSMSV